MIRFALICALLTGLLSCGDDSSPPAAEKADGTGDTGQVFHNDLSLYSQRPGKVGVYNVPEMLCLSIEDSGSASQIGAKVRQRYADLERDIRSTLSEQNGPFGQISYNNDTSNFRFECFVLIKRLPATEPEHARVVILEADYMFVYNYYGPYELLYAAYGEISKMLEADNLRQSGPLREYYYTNPMEQPDMNKLRTILMVPVRRKAS